jgi:hypothetical protein
MFFWHITWTFEFILIPQEANCKSSKLKELVLHFFPHKKRVQQTEQGKKNKAGQIR